MSENSLVKVARTFHSTPSAFWGVGSAPASDRPNAAEVHPGDVVIVVGVGGVGINAVQGAAIAGAAAVVAVDPVRSSGDGRKLGATHTFADIAEATDFVGPSPTGRAPTPRSSRWVPRPTRVAEAFDAIGKGGTSS